MKLKPVVLQWAAVACGAVGLLYALGIEGGALYDPEVNYRRVKGEIWDWADDPAPQQQATDTRAVPAATANVPVGPPALPRQ